MPKTCFILGFKHIPVFGIWQCLVLKSTKGLAVSLRYRLHRRSASRCSSSTLLRRLRTWYSTAQGAMQNATSAIPKLLTQAAPWIHSNLGSPSSCMLEDKAKNKWHVLLHQTQQTHCSSLKVWLCPCVAAILPVLYWKHLGRILENQPKMRFQIGLFQHERSSELHPSPDQRDLSAEPTTITWQMRVNLDLNGEIQVVGICCLVSWKLKH